MDLAFIGDQLGNFSTFGKAIFSLFTEFPKFVENIGNVIDKSDDLTKNTSSVFEGLSS